MISQSDQNVRYKKKRTKMSKFSLPFNQKKFSIIGNLAWIDTKIDLFLASSAVKEKFR